MKYSPEFAEANTILCLEIFYTEAERISLRRTFSQGKQPIPAHLPAVRSDSNGSPGMIAQDNIILADPEVSAMAENNINGTATTPIKRSVAQYRRPKSPDIAPLFFQVVAIKW